MEKNIEILKFSNPSKVYNKFVKLFSGRNGKYQIKLSTRKNKKYMVKFDFLKNWVHFGEMGYEDYTFHNDEKRKLKFITRNWKWAESNFYSPGYLSYFLLW